MFAALALSLLASTVVALPQASSEIAPVTPASLVQCQPILLQWSGGKAPYYVSLIPGIGNPSAAAVVDFGKLDGTSQTWIVNQAVDTDLTLKIVDSDGKYQFSAPVKVQKGSSDECLKESGASAGPSATAAGSDAAGASDAAPATDAAKETSVAPQGGAAETGATSAAAAATSTGAAASAPAASGSAAASGAKSADASHTSSASGTTASKAPAPATSSSGAGRIVASTGLIAAVVAAVAFF